MINIDQLIQKKSEGKITISREDDMLVLSEKKYDEETGEEKTKVDYLSIKELLIKRELYKKEIEKINKLLEGVSSYFINSLLKKIYG